MFRKKCVVILYDIGAYGKGSSWAIGRRSYATLFKRAYESIDEENFSITNVLKF